MIIIITAPRCCQCNGVNAKCIRCACTKEKRSCVSCLPSKSNNCQNLLSCRQRAIVKAVCSPSVSCPSSTLCPSSASDFIDALAPGYTAPTILKTVSSLHHSNESNGDESPNLSKRKGCIKVVVGNYPADRHIFFCTHASKESNDKKGS